MRRAIAWGAAGVVLAAPAAIAFFSGGFFDGPRLWAGLVAGVLVFAAAAFAERPLPREWPGRLALGGLAALAAWTAISLAWAPLGGPALDDVQRLALYALAFAAACAWLSNPAARRAAEPALALCALTVVGYGLSERLLPGVIELERSAAAGGRLAQPVTYWNAMGAIAALGVVLCVRLAGSAAREPWLRAAAAAAVPVLGAGLYLTLSRGAIAALAAGVLALVLLAPDRPQLRALAVAAGAGGVAVAIAAALPELTAAQPGGSAEGQGAAMLGALALLASGAAAAQLVPARREAAGRLARGRLATRLVIPAVAVLAVALVGTALVAAGSSGDGNAAGPGASRLRSLESNRYDYWGVALDAFAAAPAGGVGTAGFRAEWERERQVPESARDAHSLYVETAAELGVVGLVLLGMFLTGVGVAASRARRGSPAAEAAAAGPIAALVALGLHAGFDWDWEMPAVSFYALALAGLLVAASERRSRNRWSPTAASTSSGISAAWRSRGTP